MRALAAVLAALVAFNAGAAGKPKPAQPAAAPAPETRELRILQKVMPSDEGASGGGCVTVRFVIRHDGFVGDITVLEAKPEALAAPTIAALKQWQFQSFPPPDLSAVQTFNFASEMVRLPDDAIRSPYAELSGGGAVHSLPCGHGQPDKPNVVAAPAAPASDTRLLKVLHRVMPTYDLGGDGGCVTVKFVIRHDGFVGDITVLGAKPEALTEPTVAALKQWWFQSFPGPDLIAVETFSFTPGVVRLLDEAIRGSPSGDDALKGLVCGDDQPGKPKAKG